MPSCIKCHQPQTAALVICPECYRALTERTETMVQNLTCFKCHHDMAVLTYEENRIYKVACPCGCEYSFEHSSMNCAESYHMREVELHGEIDRNADLRAQLVALQKRFDAVNDFERSQSANLLAQLTEKDKQLGAAVSDMSGICYLCKSAEPYKYGGAMMKTCEHMARELGASASTKQPNCTHFEWRGAQEVGG